MRRPIRPVPIITLKTSSTRWVHKADWAEHYQGLMMNHLGLSSQDLDDMHNKRAEAAAAAGAEGKADAVPPKTMGDALAMK